MKVFISKIKSKPMDINGNLEKMLTSLDRCIENKCDGIIYPSGCLVGAMPGILSDAQWFVNSCRDKLEMLYAKAKENNVFVIGDNMKAVSSGELFENYHELCQNNTIIYINWFCKTLAGQKYLWAKALEKLSAHYGTTFVVNTAGSGYTTHPDFYAPMAGVVQNGKANIYYGFDAINNRPAVFELDVPTLKAVSEKAEIEVDFPVAYSQNPLIPANVPEKEYCLDLFDMQSESLANRIANINCKNIVLNLSGGLDSTAALLVCANAFRMLNLDKKGIHVITQPGFGTSNTTKGLAKDLCDGLGLGMQTVDITETCKAALLSVGHDGVTPDVTFENVQARVRTVNALNLANHINGIMVGTGDLSEEALGFSTYGGDQMASYNINCCVSKTVMRTMLGYVTELPMFSGVKEAVHNVLNIPVSPELVPHGGEILQKTEEILAPYKLIDFYIYCTVVTKNHPKEIAELAYTAFDGEFTKEYITEKLKMFYRKFAVAQFKRSCAPECADLTHVSLLSRDRSYPSDGSSWAYLEQLN